MSFRARLTLAVALAVAVAVAATSAITYALVRNELRGQVDDALRERVSVELGVDTNPVTGEPQLHLPGERFGGAAGITQLITADGAAEPIGWDVELRLAGDPIPPQAEFDVRDALA